MLQASLPSWQTTTLASPKPLSSVQRKALRKLAQTYGKEDFDHGTFDYNDILQSPVRHAVIANIGLFLRGLLLRV